MLDYAMVLYFIVVNTKFSECIITSTNTSGILLEVC